MKHATLIGALAIVSVLVGPEIHGQNEVWVEGRVPGEMWVLALDVFNPDGTVVVEVENLSPEQRRIVAGAVRWQQAFWQKMGRASSLGLKDGLLDTRDYCALGFQLSEYEPQPPWVSPPRFFDEWAAKSEAIIESRVTGVAPAFDASGDPAMRVTVSVNRLLFARSEFSDELHFFIPAGEFVAGDAVYCALPNWGGYEPRVGDSLILGAFFPAKGPSHSVLGQVRPAEILEVDLESGSVERMGMYSVSTEAVGFPTSLYDFVEQVRQMHLDGVMDVVSWNETALGHEKRLTEKPVWPERRDKTPKAILGNRPLYPREACGERAKGIVVVQVTVDSAGFVIDAETLAILMVASPDLHEKFRENAEKSARLWRFEPAMRNGVSIAAYHVIPLRFDPQGICRVWRQLSRQGR